MEHIIYSKKNLDNTIPSLKDSIFSDNIRKFRVIVEEILITNEEKMAKEIIEDITTGSNIQHFMISNSLMRFPVRSRDNLLNLFSKNHKMKYYSFAFSKDGKVIGKIKETHRTNYKSVDRINSTDSLFYQQDNFSNIVIVFSEDKDPLVDVRLAYSDVQISNSFELRSFFIESF